VRHSAIIAAIGTTALLLIAGTALGWSALDVLRKLLAPHLSPLAVVFYLALARWNFWAAVAGASAVYACALARFDGRNLMAFVHKIIRKPAVNAETA